MVVAMAQVRMVEAAVHEVVRMVAVRDRFVPASGAVMMASRGSIAGAPAAYIRVGLVHRQHVLGHLSTLTVVQVTIVKIADMIFVTDGGMTAAFVVPMVVGFVCMCHEIPL
jgi:hypothetical protein